MDYGQWKQNKSNIPCPAFYLYIPYFFADATSDAEFFFYDDIFIQKQTESDFWFGPSKISKIKCDINQNWAKQNA